MSSKMFHIGDLISIVKGNLVCPVFEGRSHPIDGVYEILNFMTGDELYTHALPRASKECAPILLTEYPWLADIEFPKCNQYITEWLAPLAEKHGEYHEVWTLHPEDHEVIHPLDEKILQGKEIITIDVPSEEPPSPEGDINWKSN